MEVAHFTLLHASSASAAVWLAISVQVPSLASRVMEGWLGRLGPDRGQKGDGTAGLVKFRVSRRDERGFGDGMEIGVAGWVVV